MLNVTRTYGLFSNLFASHTALNKPASRWKFCTVTMENGKLLAYINFVKHFAYALQSMKKTSDEGSGNGCIEWTSSFLQ